MTIVTIDPAIGLTKSDTHDPFPPIEFGRRDELTSGDSGPEGLTGSWTDNLVDDDNVQNPCNAFDGNETTYASATNDFNVFHVEGVQPLFSVTSSIEAKIEPNHYLYIEGAFGNAEGQANAQGIVSVNMTGEPALLRFSDQPFLSDGLPDASVEMKLYYIKVDGQYLIDPSCI